MGLLSSSVSITRYKVDGEFETPLIESVTRGLQQNILHEIDRDEAEKTSGWTSFNNPFKPDFEGSSFLIGTHFIFSLRIDKKTIPSKIVQKYYALETAKKLAETNRDFLSRSEKKLIKEHVITVLSLRIPATPNVYDIVWNYEEKDLWFFSNLKAANEELETLFSKSFKLRLIRLFPYTMADLTCALSDADRDVLSKMSPSEFTR
jgi:DNA recombination-dependent growth factor C